MPGPQRKKGPASASEPGVTRYSRQKRIFGAPYIHHLHKHAFPEDVRSFDLVKAILESLAWLFELDSPDGELPIRILLGYLTVDASGARSLDEILPIDGHLRKRCRELLRDRAIVDAYRNYTEVETQPTVAGFHRHVTRFCKVYEEQPVDVTELPELASDLSLNLCRASHFGSINISAKQLGRIISNGTSKGGSDVLPI